MRSFVKCIELGDYAEIRDGMVAVEQAVKALTPKVGGRFAIPHPHRYWEYGSAIQALISIYQERLGTNGMQVLDVGSGWSPLGPALAYAFNLKVVEVEPEFQARTARYYSNQALKSFGKKEITVLDGGVERLPDEMFDAVFCISVIEHVNPKDELQGWKNLAERVKPGGMLFMTTDCVPKAGEKYEFDYDRAQNFTIDVLQKRVEMLEEMGMSPMGKPDYTFTKPEVYDYTFFRMGMWRA